MDARYDYSDRLCFIHHESHSSRFSETKEISLFKLLGILAVVFGGIVEEVFSRRWTMVMLMSRGVAPVFRVIISGLAFGLAHTIWLPGKGDLKFAIPEIHSTSVLGVFLAIDHSILKRYTGFSELLTASV